MTNTYTIFYYEHDPDFARKIQEFLTSSPVKLGEQSLAVEHYASALEAMDAIDKWTPNARPHLALLDVHQPDYTAAGLDICKKIRKDHPKVPVVFLSDLDDLPDLNRGVTVGATNYLSKKLHRKPDFKEYLRNSLISQMELVEVVENHEPACYETGSLKVNTADWRVIWNDKTVNLTEDNVRIVHEMARPRNRDEIVPYSKLRDVGSVRGDHDQEVVKANVRKRIQHIRQEFRRVDPSFPTPCPAERQELPHGILNVQGRGYRWKPDC